MRKTVRHHALGLTACLTMLCPLIAGSATASAAEPPQSAAAEQMPAFRFERMDMPDQSKAIPLNTGPQADTVPPENWFRMNGAINVRNISQATITPILPAAGKGSGTAVIVAPGGGFLGLAIEEEGYKVGQWLADHGIAAFVLKYRVVPTPSDFDVFTKEMTAGRTGKPSSISPPADTPAYSEADALAAIRLVRARAKEWNIDPQRVGMMGFSAGAFTTLTLTLNAAPQDRPNFIVPVYGRMVSRPVPADAPPLYAVIAADDGLFSSQGFGLIDAWMAARRPAEFHLYQNGGHGFGLGKAGTTSDGWINGLLPWLRTNNFLPIP